MNASTIAIILAFCFSVMSFFEPTLGGVCWSAANRNGRCLEILSLNVSKQECCQRFDDPTAAWSMEDLDNGKLFYIRVVGIGVVCQNCKDSCTGVQCETGKKCVMKNGRPECVCASCKASAGGPVCGTDGISYENICRLKKYACRRQISNLEVAYEGRCKSSCEKLTCPEGEFCIVDQNMTPHCVVCPECPQNQNIDPDNQFCGSDGKTYDSLCQLRYAACTTGKGIPIAYKGKCKETASCSTISCGDGQLCLIEPNTKQPRCVTCDLDCPKSIEQQRREFGGPICGTNNKTYHNWCQMKKDSCDSGIVIETKSQGSCPKDERRRSVRKGRTHHVH